MHWTHDLTEARWDVQKNKKTDYQNVGLLNFGAMFLAEQSENISKSGCLCFANSLILNDHFW